MVVKLASTCLQWSQPIVPHSTPSSQTLASAIASPSSKRRTRGGDGGAVLCLYVHSLNRSALFGAPSTKLNRSRSCELRKPRFRSMKRACSANLDAFSDEEFSKKIQELALRFHLSDDFDGEDNGDGNTANSETERADSDSGRVNDSSSTMRFEQNQSLFELPLDLELPWSSDWQQRDEIVPEASIERRANSVDLPLSLRMIKRKLQWQEGFREAGESACSSVKKAFASMVFIIRELHTYTLQMREVLFYEDLQGILGRVQKEMHASFVWLFQQVFSQTPTLMVYVMILLANFTVYSLGHNAAIAAAPPPGIYSSATETSISVEEVQNHNDKLDNTQFDSSTSKSFSVNGNVNGKTTSIGGNNGGGGKARPVGSGTEGDGRFDGTDQYRTIVPDGASQLSSLGTTTEAESVSGQESREELAMWNSIVEEAHEMRGNHEALNHETMQRFVSPVVANMEGDDYEEYFRTELLYQTGLSIEPSNALLLANYAQFLYQVAHDYDRAEEYFKKAVGLEPPDAEAYNKYATFLWRVRNDLWAAEETFLEAISADPSNSYYAANYAHFLWDTGAEDTCFPLNSPDDATQDA
ncbi:PREDICTED: Tetratricopeptide [Prunus dulcis]|uniref:PREDICTED: Tetratricopeptide n=1 Tax=Prunus dulcis TaxID=3755 RepID=A0A5E4FX97_PRUDU|nr:uncharacterized protein LOC117631611 [Prunus dulcis]VVA32126.1 PREDICTED: Tetratricopeptide [Prunus dulcis]